MSSRNPGPAVVGGDGPPERQPVVRLMEEDDVEAVAALEQQAFSSPWKADTFRRLMTRNGTELWVLERARELGIRNLYLEVRVSNERAVGLYERRGFLEIGRRRDYYQRPREDARVLLKRLT